MLQLPFQPDHAKVVYDKQVVCVELAEEVGLPSFEMYELEVLDEHVHREVKHLDAIAARPVTQRTGIVGLSCPCRACDDESRSVGNVVAGGKVAGGCGGDSPGGVCLQFLDGSLEAEVGVLDESLDAVVLTGVALVLQHLLHSLSQGESVELVCLLKGFPATCHSWQFELM